MIKFATLTKEGSRDVNEDSIGHAFGSKGHCFVVCDGLGGHGMGDVASGLVRDIFIGLYKQKTTDVPSFMEYAYNASNDLLLAEQISRSVQKKMKTTCVVLITEGEKAYVGHIGDSRLYVFKKDKVLTRTFDHSVPQMLVETKEITEKEIRHHKERNVVTHVMGVEWESPEYELMKPLKLNKCQAFLLCTDGFWELIEEEDMCKTLKAAKDPEEWLRLMEDIVKSNGTGTNMDNYSAIVVWNEKEGHRWF